MSKLGLPVQINPLFVGPLVAGDVVSSLAERDAYLTDPRRYPGKMITVAEPGKPNRIFTLSSDLSSWEPVTSGEDVVIDGGTF